MARRTHYDEQQLARNLHVPITKLRWAVHTGLVPAPDTMTRTWPRAVVDAIDRTTIEASLPGDPIGAWQAARLVAEALGLSWPPDEPCPVKVFTVGRFVRLGLLFDLTAQREEWQFHPDQVAQVCVREDLADLVERESPLGPNQAAERLGLRRSDWDHLVRLGWVRPTLVQPVRFGSSKRGAVRVPIFRAGDVDAVPQAHPEVDWEALRRTEKGRRSPLSALRPANVPATIAA
ncbi:hypothetical protein ACIQF6_28415 [Kitasatospora sp. NPDC092948]|uniref:hypothetical protein n=1 Tax=Kitasatospora sp. NPDC092948 TaxID=3364088 RepID=UPI0038144748